MADIHGSPGDAPQMPAAGSGPAPVPYAGPDLSPEPPVYSVTVDIHAPGVDVMSGVSGNALQESGYAHDVSAGLVADYYPGSPSAISTGGGTGDDVAGTVAGAVAGAESRFLAYQSAAAAGHAGVPVATPMVPEDATTPVSDFLYPQGNQPGA